MFRTFKILPIFLAILALSSLAPAPAVNLRPHGPIIFTPEIRTNPALRLYVAKVDLTDPSVHVKVACAVDPTSPEPWNISLLTVSSLARRNHLAIAINGSPFGTKDAESILGIKYPYFDGNPTRPIGWLVSDGVLLTRHPKHPDWPTLVVEGKNHASIGQFMTLPPQTTQALTGTFVIVKEGKSARLPDEHPEDKSILAPRTAVGVDHEGKNLIFLVVDGRRPGYSEGISEYQVGQEMLRLGAWTALILDSGGSSTMAVSYGGTDPTVVNRPSDGHDLLIPLSIERSVANCIGVAIDSTVDGSSGADN